MYRFLNYDFADTGFFEILQEKTALWGDHEKYRRPNIEWDPDEQGFELESQDCIIAANAPHSTERISHTMTNIRKLLKPDGSLVLEELMKKKRVYTNIFGIFDRG
ncbi:uncharacterized protein BCR38DRAFT_342280 [Pseudomassariella vexata]|uniref:Uncharacterized protein n=1 Tax=Pseudomassariella vexata TaxID=1141098 RepID=A0A1Y2E0N7_9PEZI|nr:uncharacterized protein BCR38DRAFT_342280 [Pseudomassariella vexata]ORY65111.1 hypothetical protein BCR38DRAFT_342280 [Pseudomassariella vexata]